MRGFVRAEMWERVSGSRTNKEWGAQGVGAQAHGRECGEWAWKPGWGRIIEGLGVGKKFVCSWTGNICSPLLQIVHHGLRKSFFPWEHKHIVIMPTLKQKQEQKQTRKPHLSHIFLQSPTLSLPSFSAKLLERVVDILFSLEPTLMRFLPHPPPKQLPWLPNYPIKGSVSLTCQRPSTHLIALAFLYHDNSRQSFSVSFAGFLTSLHPPSVIMFQNFWLHSLP